MKLIAGQAEYDIFPYWDRCAIRVAGFDYMLNAMDSASIDMREIDPNLVGVPIVLIRMGNSDVLRAWPKPDQDYEVVL
jgi:hypothetical protein